VLAVRFNVEPSQIGPLLPAVGAAGVGLITTAIVPSGLEAQPGTVALTEYVPAAKAVTPAIEGFCVEAEKPLGPAQE
jgi:hypothetical protein